jgi:hypothetical protein
MGGRRLFRSDGLERAKGWRQRVSGGHGDVAYMGNLTKVVESRHTGGVGISGPVRFSLHHSWSLRLDACSPTP